MGESRCAFHLVVRAHQAACSQAEHVTRRDGPDVLCADPQAQARCALLYQRLKDAALPAFGVADDPLTVPQATLAKVQLGGLLGLQGLLDADSESVSDVHGVVSVAVGRFGSVGAVPVGDLVDGITQLKLKRRRRQ
jgi:hypothetical protein